MNVDPRNYVGIYDEYRDILLPGIKRTGADLADAASATYSITVTTFDPHTGFPASVSVIGLNRQDVLSQIAQWQEQIARLQKCIDNANLFLKDADGAPLV